MNLQEGDIAVLARALGIDGDSLRDELDRRPWHANDVLRRPEVVESVLHGTGAEQFSVSPLLFFAVLVHRAADELMSSDWVDEWAGPGCRLPVFDVEPLLEFADAPARLQFTAQLLASFAVPEAAPVPVDRLDLDELVDWLGAVAAARPHRAATPTRRPRPVSSRCVPRQHRRRQRCRRRRPNTSVDRCE